MTQIASPRAATPIVAPNIASPQFKANPYPFYARLRAEAPVYRIALPNRLPAWLVAGYDDVQTVLKDERFVKDGNVARAGEKMSMPRWVPGIVRALERNMLDLDGDEHTRLRSLVHRAFTPRLVERLRARIEVICDQLLADARRAGRIDLIRQYALPLPVTIIAEMLGVPPRDRHKFQAWSKRIVAVTSASDMLRALPQMWMFMRYIRRLTQQRRTDPQDDLVTALVQAEESGDVLSEEELLAMVFLLLIAGHETTVNLIGNGTLALLEHPDQLDLLRRQPDLIRPAIEELLRFASPVEIATERFAREDVALGGVTIPRGEVVLAVLASANRDERQFARPDALDITRDPNRHVAFGQGIHYCLGAPLARLEGQIAMGALLRELPNLRLASPVAALRWRKSLFLRGMERLPVAF